MELDVFAQRHFVIFLVILSNPSADLRKVGYIAEHVLDASPDRKAVTNFPATVSEVWKVPVVELAQMCSFNCV